MSDAYLPDSLFQVFSLFHPFSSPHPPSLSLSSSSQAVLWLSIQDFIRLKQMWISSTPSPVPSSPMSFLLPSPLLAPSQLMYSLMYSSPLYLYLLPSSVVTQHTGLDQVQFAFLPPSLSPRPSPPPPSPPFSPLSLLLPSSVVTQHTRLDQVEPCLHFCLPPSPLVLSISASLPLPSSPLTLPLLPSLFLPLPLPLLLPSSVVTQHTGFHQVQPCLHFCLHPLPSSQAFPPPIHLLRLEYI